MKRHGVFATTDERKMLKGLASAPYVAFSDPLREAHKLALAHGLPEIEGYYGCDLETGEFLSA